MNTSRLINSNKGSTIRPKMGFRGRLLSFLLAVASGYVGCTGLTTDQLGDGAFLPEPDLRTVIALSATSIQLAYSQDMQLAGVSAPENYSLANANGDNLAISDVLVTAGSGNKIVVVQTDPQLPAELYTLEITGVQTKVGRRASGNRIRYQFTGYELAAPGLVYSANGLQVTEGGRVAIGISLSAAPKAPVTVDLTGLSFDNFDSFNEDLLSGVTFEDQSGNSVQSLTFMPQNSNTQQQVYLRYPNNNIVHSTLFAAVQLSALSSADEDYDGLVPMAFTLTVLEDSDFLPTATGLSPFAWQRNFPLTKPILEIQFSKTMNSATLSQDTIKVYDTSQSPEAEVDGYFVYGPGRNTASFTMAQYAQANTIYRIDIAGEVEDAFGNQLAGGLGASWQFTTGAWTLEEEIGINLSDISTAVQVFGNYAYVGKDNDHEVLVYDISDPDLPLLKGTYSEALIEPRRILATDDRLYFIARPARFRVLDISDQDCSMVVVDGVPPAPCATIIRQAQFDSSQVLASGTVKNNYAYLVEGKLEVVDLANQECGSPPCALTLAAEYDFGGIATDVFVEGNYAYVVTSNNQLLQIIDLSNQGCGSPPCALSLASTFSLPSNAEKINVHNNIAYVATLTEGLQIIDVANPNSPQSINTISKAENNYLTQASQIDYPYLTVLDSYELGNDSILRLIDISDIQNPVTLGADYFGGFSIDLSVQGKSVLFVGANTLNATSRFHQINIPVFQPTIVSETNLANNFVTGIDGYLYASHSGANALKVIDNSLPTAPLEVGSLSLGCTPFGAAIKGNTLWQTCGATGLLSVDISSRAQPTLAATVDTPNNADSLKIKGNYAYVADGATVEVVDISNASSPQIVGSYIPTGTVITTLEVQGSTLYVSLVDDGFDIVSLADPENPAFIANHTTANFGVIEVAIKGNVAYALGFEFTDFQRQIAVVDITNPAAPAPVTIVSTGGELTLGLHGSTIRGDFLWTLNDESSIAILDISTPTAPSVNRRTSFSGNYDGLRLDGPYLYLSGVDDLAIAYIGDN